MDKDLKSHWENIYDSKPMETFSWYQPYPIVSMEIINELSVPANAAIIDVGGGDGFLVDALLAKEFTDITLLDISSNALKRAKDRLGSNASKVKWMESDIREFNMENTYDLWHDRATFHFLREPVDIRNYVATASKAIKKEGYLILGAFSEDGPMKCSGLDIQQYSLKRIEEYFANHFNIIKHLIQVHHTPQEKIQEFLFVVMKKK